MPRLLESRDDISPLPSVPQLPQKWHPYKRQGALGFAGHGLLSEFGWTYPEQSVVEFGAGSLCPSSSSLSENLVSLQFPCLFRRQLEPS